MADVYQQVTDRIIEALDRGVAPWVRPWTNDPTGGEDRNLASGKAYRGVNVLLLWLQRHAHGFSSPLWVTYQQAKERGGHVKRGQKGTQIVFWKVNRFERDGGDDGTETVDVPMARNYTVFNVEQCEGLELPASETPAAAPELPERLAHAKAFCAATGAVIKHGGDKAFYSPGFDRIQMPKRAQFETPEHYFNILLHELTHWTGHKSRCEREFGKRFGDDAYAVEELVAELGAAFGTAALGLQGELRHVEYLGNWLKVLRGDKRAIFTAASQARKAHEFLAAFSAEEKAA